MGSLVEEAVERMRDGRSSWAPLAIRGAFCGRKEFGMHVLICDDDAAFGARMADYIHDYFEARSVQLQTVVCTGAAEALRTPYLELYQLAFLDVDMPGTNGIALGRELKQRSPDIRLVYVSAYLEFAPEGYTVNAYRYLLKRDIARMLPKCAWTICWRPLPTSTGP